MAVSARHRELNARIATGESSQDEIGIVSEALQRVVERRG